MSASIERTDTRVCSGIVAAHPTHLSDAQLHAVLEAMQEEIARRHSIDDALHELTHAPAAPSADATGMLIDAADQITDRADQRDAGQDGERSMARTVAMFNALTAHDLTELEGWSFMGCLKLARAQNGRYVRDDYVDAAAYMALAGECAALSSGGDHG